MISHHDGYEWLNISRRASFITMEEYIENHDGMKHLKPEDAKPWKEWMVLREGG